MFNPALAFSLLAAGNMSKYHEVIIVGGGMGGLYTASKLIAAGINDIVILESRGSLGGRVSTTYDADGNPMFNNFAWRVGETNTMMIALAKELGVKLIPQTTPPPMDEKEGHGTCKHGVLSSLFEKKCDAEAHTATKKEPSRVLLPNRAPLSDFAQASLESAASADLQDRESGYAGRTSQISWPDESHGSNAFVVEGGMDRLPKELGKTLPEGCVNANCRVTEVERTENGYKLAVVKRDGNTYTNLDFSCSQVVLATPPYSLRRLKVAEDMLPALFAVHERRLGHAYAKCAPGTPDVPDRSDGPDRIYRNLPNSILQQVISGDYGGGIFQAAYACDRFEKVWRELQYQGPDVVKNEIKKQLTRISDLKKPPQGWDCIEEVYIRIGFVHRWHNEAHVTGKNKEKLSMQAITPNPARLPGLYLVGEAFSPYQGWTEGALWTAEKAAAIIAQARQSPGVYDLSKAKLSEFSQKVALEKGEGIKYDGPTPKIIIYKGMVMDVNDWDQRHPGGAGMINGHSGEDISDLFDNFHNGWPAPLATMFGLQIGST